MNSLKRLLNKSKKKTTEDLSSTYGSYQVSALGPSIVDIYVADDIITEVTFKESLPDKAGEQFISLTIRSEQPPPDFDIVEEFIGAELREFYAECKSLEEHCRKSRIQKHVTSYLFNIWKENIDRNKN